MVEWELAYLKEVGKISIESTRIRGSLESEIALRFDETPFDRVVKESLSREWTRDPFDLTISATAIANKAKLLTKDRVLLKN